MRRIDYFALMAKHIHSGSLAYSFYAPHVVLVTAKALRIAERFHLSLEQMRFIEEAAMLHDIGMVRTRVPDIGCEGELPYLCHALEGKKILEEEGLPDHARVAERHTGVGIFKDEILENGYPLPPADYVPETLPEKIVSYADIFYSKVPGRLWRERSVAEARELIARFGDRHARIFDEWTRIFG